MLDNVIFSSNWCYFQGQQEFNVKQLFRTIQGHSYGDHRKAVEGLYCMLYTHPRYPV